MGYPEYPEHGYHEDLVFGVYLHPSPDECPWGIVTVAGGSFDTRKQLIPSNGRVLDEFGLVLITRGNGVCSFADEVEQPVRAGNLLVLLPGEWHRYHPDRADGWSEMWLLFDGAVPNDLRDSKKVLGSSRVVSLNRFAHWRQRFAEIVNLLAHQEEALGSLQGSLAARILQLLVELRRLELSDSDSVSDPKIEAVLLQLEEELPVEPDWDAIAAASQMSSSQFRRRFRRYTGTSPHQHLLSLRIRKAQEYLTRSKLPVEEIAHRLGYGGSTQFTRIFKAKTGLSPRSWRSGSRPDL